MIIYWKYKSFLYQHLLGYPLIHFVLFTNFIIDKNQPLNNWSTINGLQNFCIAYPYMHSYWRRFGVSYALVKYCTSGHISARTDSQQVNFWHYMKYEWKVLLKHYLHVWVVRSFQIYWSNKEPCATYQPTEHCLFACCFPGAGEI